MKKNGRPKKDKSDKKSKRWSVRATEEDDKLIVDRYGSRQTFVDTVIEIEKSQEINT